MIDVKAMQKTVVFSVCLILCLLVYPPRLAIGQSSLADSYQAPSWRQFNLDEVRDELFAWLNQQSINQAERDSLLAAWDQAVASPANHAERLDLLADVLSAANPSIAELVDLCHTPQAESKASVPSFSWLAEGASPRLVSNNMRLYYARWLVQSDLYDEALDLVEGLSPQDVIDPATLLFYSAAAHHHLAHAAEAEAIAAKLLERETEIPERFRQVAGLVQKDNEGVEVDSLDHIARRMADIRRRLGKGRAGATVQQIENGVIDALDKLIEELEEQQQQSSQLGQAGGIQSGSPMQDSQLPELKAPGKVDHRELGKGGGWGNLPPKEREQALQQIGREFPAHYREVIQQYFIELANESSSSEP